MPFYLRHTMIMVQYQDDLSFSIEQSAEKSLSILEFRIQR
nr:hypothetical protein [Mycoavidus cysteinexigens]